MAEKGFGKVDREVAHTVVRAAEKLREAGFCVEPAKLPGLENRDCNLLSMTLFTAESGFYFEPIVAEQREKLYPFLRNRLSSRVDSIQEYLRACSEVEGLRRDLGEFFGH